MDSLYLAFVGGMVLGLASALHCASMCGGIASGIVFLFRPAGTVNYLTVLMAMQGGRIAAYSIAGGTVGLAGSAAFGFFEPSQTYRVMQWAAAVSLMWIGLSIAGLMPAPSLIDSRVAALSGRVGRSLAFLRARPVLGPLVAGFTWGISPCPMVYGALFSAALTGTLQGGAALMAGFGIGTVPAVVASAFGITRLAKVKTGPIFRSVLGLAIAAIGFATVQVDWPRIADLCLPG